MIFPTASRKWLLLGAATAAVCATPAGEAAEEWLTDVSAEVGLHFVHDPGVGGDYYMPESIGSGGALLDYDGDGDLDVYLLNGARRPPGEAPLRNRLFRQEGDGSLRDVTEASGVGDTGYGMGVAVGDADGDGDLDLYLANAGPDALYRNRGDGSFDEVSREAGVDNTAWGASAVFFDPDLDGDLDLYVVHYVDFDPTVVCTDRAGRRDYCGPDGFPGVADRFFRNLGGGRFRDDSAAAGIGAVARTGLGAAAADLDVDGWPDLYVANDGEPNLLWINRGDGSFEDQAVALGAAVNQLGRPEAGMGVALGDADGDGALDLFVSHLRDETNTLYRAAGAAGFADDTLASGLGGTSRPYTGFGTAFLDFDLDGDLDLAVVNGRVTRGPLLTTRRPASYWDDYAEPNLLFLNEGGRFTDRSTATGAYFAEPENSRGLATGDVDGDGDLDLLVTNEGGPARLYRNDGPRRGDWLLVRAVHNGCTSEATGTEIEVVNPLGQLRRTVTAGGSFLSSSDPRAHFGLGEASGFDRLEVRWPNGARSRYLDLPSHRQIVVCRSKNPR